MPHLEHKNELHGQSTEEMKDVSRDSTEAKKAKQKIVKAEEETAPSSTFNGLHPLSFGLGQMYVPSELIGHE